MSATTPMPPKEGDAAFGPARKGDVMKTALLHVALFILVVILFFAAFFGLDILRDDEQLYQFAANLWIRVPPMVFVISVIVSIVLLALRRRAFFVPLVAAALIVVCVTVAFLLANASAKEEWKFFGVDSTHGGVLPGSPEYLADVLGLIAE